MDFVANQSDQMNAMLKSLGIPDVEVLFSDIPAELRLPKTNVDNGLSEFEGMCFMESIGKKNTFSQYENYLGGGAYEHHVPALVQAICSKSEFLTSYTPYQAEASQGMLQAIFEFQSVVCAITGMDVANASMYDGATACAEAMLMALRIHKDRNKVVVAKSLHPHYQTVVEQFLSSHQVVVEWIPFNDGSFLDQEAALALIDESTAAVLLSYPNFFGIIDSVAPVFAHAKTVGALSIICANPLVYGLYASASELGADIAVGDLQPLGLPLQFGGPYVGYMACREEFLRQLPGRIVGETVDLQQRRGYVLTLQAREQHIRREKATSNICTNQALAALASLVCVLWYGKEGLKKLSLTNYQRAMYLKENLEKIPGVKTIGGQSIFNEFAVCFGSSVKLVIKHFRDHGIEPGIEVGRFYPEMKDYLLVAATETKDKEALDRYLKVAKLTKCV